MSAPTHHPPGDSLPGITGQFWLSNLLIDTRSGQIGDNRVTLKAMQVLARLAASAPHPVSGEDLIESVWPDVIVVSNVLYQAITELRGAFGDSARCPRYIETIPRRGYRLIVPVTAVRSDKSSAEQLDTLLDV